MATVEISVTHATMMDIELKPATKKDGKAKVGFNISLEVGRGGGAMGDQVIVRAWIEFDPARTPLSEVQAAAAAHAHRVLQAAAASSQAHLAQLLTTSLLPKD